MCYAASPSTRMVALSLASACFLSAHYLYMTAVALLYKQLALAGHHLVPLVQMAQLSSRIIHSAASAQGTVRDAVARHISSSLPSAVC